MTTLAFVSDVHVANHKRLGGPAELGINDRCRLTINALRFACWEAHERGAARLYVAGDLFDNVTPGPRVLSAVQDVLAESRQRGTPVVIIPGNHDQISSDPGNHALGPLRYVAEVVDRPAVDRLGDAEVVLVPHRTGNAAGWLRGAILEAEDEGPEGRAGNPSKASLDPFRILVLHLGISTSSAPSYLRADPNSVDFNALAELVDEFGFDLVVAGHWHDLSTYNFGDARGVQLGALAPSGWGDAGVEDRGRMLLVDRAKLQSVEVPGPRFVRVRGADGTDELEELAKKARDSRLFAEWLVSPEAAADARDDLRVLLERGVVYRGAVTLDVEDASEEAREAAAAARSADSLSEALGTYVEKIKLPAGVDRERVLELSKRFTGID